jgi:hypothetical protein
MKRLIVINNNLGDAIEYQGQPIYYKLNGVYGYLMPNDDKVLFFTYDDENGLTYEELPNCRMI